MSALSGDGRPFLHRCWYAKFAIPSCSQRKWITSSTWIRTFIAPLTYIDQSVFNIVFYRNWAELPRDYNFQCPIRYGLFDEISKGRKINLHYVTNPKAWQVPVDQTTACFYASLDQTAFRGWRPNPVYWAVHLKLRTWKYHLFQFINGGKGLLEAP